MKNITLSIIADTTLTEILNETKSFWNYDVVFFDNLELFLKESKKFSHNSNVLITDLSNQNFLESKNGQINLPIVYIANNFQEIKNFLNLKKSNNEVIFKPFKLDDFINKIKLCLSKNKFLENSLIKILDYQLDINQREINKNNKCLKLTEKEIDFLLFLTKMEKPQPVDSILKFVWKYSNDLETHTVETHVHRLRKKFFDTFDESNFIKNNKNGYYI